MPNASLRRAATILQLTVLAAVLLSAAACGGAKITRDPIFSNDALKVQLRRTVVKGQPVDKGYAHPATVADVRLAHVLASIEHEDKNGKRQPTIPSEVVYQLAEQLNKAAAKATPADEIAAVVFAEDLRYGVFKSRRVTSFRAYFATDALVFDFYDVNRTLEPGEARPGQEYEIPIDVPPPSSAFKVMSGPSQTAANARSLRVSWRDDYFAKPVALSVREGRFRRRTVISEANGSKLPDEPLPPLDPDPARRDAQLRALDQLEAARRSGLVTEAEFQKRRRLILDGKLEEAGYGSAP